MPGEIGRFGPHGMPAARGLSADWAGCCGDVGASVLAPLRAHVSSRMADRAIRPFTPAQARHELGLAERRVTWPAAMIMEAIRRSR